MNKVRVRTAERPDHTLLAILAALLLALTAVVTTAGISVAQDAEEPAESMAAEEPMDDAVDDGEADTGIDGTWTVNTEIGTFEGTDDQDAFSSSWAGFRVAEVLRNVGDTEAVGRTPDVSGQLTANGSTIDNAAIEVDLTTIKSDRNRRDRPIQDALDTSSFPTASFVSSEPVDLGGVPVEGEPFSASVPGTLTIRGVDKDVVLDMNGQRVGDVVVVVGTLPIDFTEFDVTMPVLGPVVSVEDIGSLEWQLFLQRES